MSKTVTWLHFSDMHLCQPKTGWEASRILETLRVDLDKMRDRGLLPDLIFFTGDAAFGQLGSGDLSIGNQFTEAITFFDQVRQIYVPEVPAENLFIVPGNHDVNRENVASAITDWLEGCAKKPGLIGLHEIQEMLRKRDRNWQLCMERLQDYHAFLMGAGLIHLLQDNDRLIYGVVREVRGTTVGVAGLNSAWSCVRDSEKGKMWLGGHWQIETLRPKVANADVKVALMHHPPNWFGETEDPSLNREFERTFHFLLHGHEHQNWVTEYGDKHVRIAAGACYGSSSSESGYNLVRLNLDDGTGEVWLRRYDESGIGWVPRAVFDETDDHGLWPLKNLPCKRPATTPASKITASAEKSLTPPLVNTPEERGVFGRRTDIERVVNALSQKPIVVVYGLTGIGKTRVIQEVRHHEDYQHFGYLLLPAHPSSKLSDFYRHIALLLGSVEEDPRPPVRLFGKLDFSDMISFAQRGSRSPCLIHIDRAHHLFDQNGFYNPDVQDFLLALASQVPHVKIILESREQLPPQALPRDVCEALHLSGLSRDSLRAYFRYPFKDDLSKGWSLDEAQTNAIYRRLGGNDKHGRAHPLAMFLLAAVADGLGEFPLQVLERHNQLLIEKLREELFKDLYARVLKDTERQVLRLCALYRDYIPDFHVGQINKLVDDPGAFIRLVQRCLLNSDEDQERYTLHNIIADLTRLEIDTASDEFRTHHANIADAWLARLKLDHHPSVPNIMVASEAVYHLTQAEEYDRLDELPRYLLPLGDVTAYLEKQAYHLKMAGREKENQRVLELLVALDPQNHKAHRFLGEAIEELQERGDARALEHYEIAHKLYPSYAPYLADFGRCLLARGEPARFVGIVENLDDLTYQKSMDGHSLSLYTRCLDELKRSVEASQLRQAQIAAGARNAAFYADEALYLRNRGQVEEALAVLTKAEQAGVTDHYLLAIKAGLLEQLGQGAEASQLRQAQIAAGARHAVFYADEALYLRSLGQPEEALAVLTKAEQAGVTDHYLLAIKAGLLEQLGQGTEASQLRQAQIAAGARHAVFYNDEALYLRNRDQVEEALAVLTKAEQAGVTDHYLLAIKAGLLEQLGQGAEASQLRQVQIAAGTRDAVFYNDEALYLRNRGQVEEALAVLTKAEQAGVTDHYLLAIKAGLLEQLGQGAKASQLRQAQIAAGARHAVFYNDEAIYLRNLGQSKEALAVLAKAEQAGLADEYTQGIKNSLVGR